MHDQRIMVSLEGVTKSYRQGDAMVPAVVDVSLRVHAGEFVSIMGPSGSGKSTLLHLIGGLDRPDAGEIVVSDRRLSALSDDQLTLLRRRAIGFVFQFFNLLPTLTAAENVALPLLLDGKPPRDIRPRVDHLLELVGLGHRAGHRPDQLSGGEMQRVAIARALVIEPLVLLADEPTGNLDSRTGEQILHLMRGIGERFARAVIMVTHDPRAAASCDRGVTLRDGRVESDGARAA
jgi:putative ABC transport system ATP-binding protein